MQCKANQAVQMYYIVMYLPTKPCDKKPLDLLLSHNHRQLLLETSAPGFMLGFPIELLTLCPESSHRLKLLLYADWSLSRELPEQRIVVWERWALEKRGCEHWISCCSPSHPSPSSHRIPLSLALINSHQSVCMTSAQLQILRNL